MKNGKRKMSARGKRATRIRPKPRKIELPEKLMALNQHASKLGSATKVEDIVQITLDAMEFALGFDYADFSIVENHRLRTMESRKKEMVYEYLSLAGRSVLVKAARTKATLLVPDTTKEPAYVDRAGIDWKGPPTMLSELTVPVIVDGEAVAVLNVESARTNVFTEEDQKLLEILASHVASVYKRLRYEEALRNQTDLLRESEERYRLLFENNPIGIGLSTADGKVLSTNKAMRSIIGWPEEEIGKISLADTFENKHDRENLLQRLSHDGMISNYSARLKRKDGSPYDALLNISRILAGGKELLQTTCMDVTEGKKIEQALQISEERYRRIFENMADAVAVYEVRNDGNDFVFKEFNRAAEGIEGTKREEVLGKSVLKTFPGIKDFGLLDVFQRVWRTGEPERHPVSLYKDEKIASWRENYVYKLPSGEIVAIYEDVTKRKRMEDELRRYSERLEELVKERTQAVHQNLEQLSAVDATVLDITQHYDLLTLINTIVQRAVHLLRARGGGLYLCDPERQEVCCFVNYNTLRDYKGIVLKYGEGAAGTVAKTGQPLLIQDYSKWDGRATIYEAERPFGAVLAVPLIWEDQVLGTIDIMDDPENRTFNQDDVKLLTRFAAHAAIAVRNTQLVQRLLKTERMAGIGETAAMVGHDLRNPLQAISAFTYTLRTEAESISPEKRRELTDQIDKSVDYADGIVRDLLDYAGEMHLQKDKTTPRALARDAIAQVTAPQNVQIVDLTKDAPKLEVDTARVQRAFVNVIENAIGAISGTGTITIRSEETNSDLEISFTDTGPGMPKEILGKLWKPLITTKSKGLGLGLAICRRVVEAHGGSVSLESPPGQGVTVTMRFPVRTKGMTV